MQSVSFLPEHERLACDSPVNAMSVDVEDWFQVSAFEGSIARSSWDSLDCRVERNVERILGLFEEAGIKATFFTLGWIAERYPQVVRSIVGAGHELASHGYSHVRATEQSEREFREDVTRTKAMLEDLSGVAVNGYRATSYSIDRRNLWALDELQRAGYRYSSSIYPIRHDLYGMPDAPRFAFRTRPGAILEIPITTIDLGPKRIPCGGGGFFRLFPYAWSRWALRRVNQDERQPGVFYFHPWEIDPQQPRVSHAPLRSRVRHYLALERMEPRLKQLLRDFRWSRMDHAFALVHAP
ncbi:MAG TPA: XrtA system polysaccharide deacetylase [Steroidobacteraceae bacterium]|nr:XrtA system polysaccharide deacetylase [Steroidobacteraceae bacterium]